MLLSTLLLGEHLRSLQWIGIILVIVASLYAAINLHAIHRANIKSFNGIYYAAYTALAWGIANALSGSQAKRMGWIRWLFWQYIIQLLLLGTFYIYRQRNNLQTVIGDLVVNNKSGLSYVVFNFIAVIAISVGFGQGTVSIVLPITGAAPLFMIFLAITHLKEKISRKQLIASLVIVMGLIILSLG